MKIVIIEAAPITPKQDAGSRALLDFYLSLQELGHETSFLFESEVNLEETLSKINPRVVFVSRPGLYRRTNHIYEKLNCKVIYIAHDLHFKRISLQEDLLGLLNPNTGEVIKNIEKFCVLSSDLSIFPTEDEANYANELFKTNKATHINYFRFEKAIPKLHDGTVNRLIFVGGSDHKPNHDGIIWFIDKVLKEIKIEFPDIQLFVVGRWDKELQKPLQQKGITFSGLLSESELSKVMNESDVGIAPLRFGAGMKRKVLNYMAHGLPVISTSFGAQGLTSAVNNGIDLANSPKEWSSSVHDLGEVNYRQIQGFKASKYINKHFSLESQKKQLKLLLKCVEEQ